MRKLAYAVLVLCLAAGAAMADEKKTTPAVEEQPALASESGKPLPVTIMANGAVTVQLDDRFDHKLVAFVNEAGQIELACTDDHQFAESLMAEPVDTILRIRSARGRRTEMKAERE